MTGDVKAFSGTRTVGLLGSGELVIDRNNSHCHVDLALLREALQRVKLPSNMHFLKTVVGLGRVIGQSHIVSTRDVSAEHILWAIRKGRNGWSRFCKVGQAQPCSSLVIILKKTEENSRQYVLISAFVGDDSYRELYDPRAQQADIMFWREHALLWGCEEVDESTIQQYSPYVF